MKPLTVIYWSRVLLGVVAALISTLLGALIGDPSFFNGLTIALLVYIIAYYVYKPLFLAKVEKPQKIFTTGIFAYFLTWIVTFVMFFTLMGPTLTITSPTANAVFFPGDTVTIVTKITNQFGTTFSGANVTAVSPTNALIQLNETSPGMYLATYNVTSADPAGNWNIRVAALINGRYRETSITVLIQTGV